MKNASTIKLAFLTIAALATVPQAQPESEIATPAEKAEITQSAPDLGQSEKENWLRLREERKQARQQILSDIKANAHAEIKDIQQDINLQKTSNNALNENKNIAKENIINKEKGQIEKNRDEWEKQHPENPPFDVPRPNEHIPFPKGPKF